MIHREMADGRHDGQQAPNRSGYDRLLLTAHLRVES